jgi:O-methyltransferase involved in polyketide biosynthesis
MSYSAGGPGPKFDVSVPNVARIYDYLLGGKDNYQADRNAAEQLKKVLPDVELVCRQNRRYLERVVRFLVCQCGIRQIIDIGAGLPTQGNVHQVAHDEAPGTRVVYADYDHVVVRHAEALLAKDERVAVVHADLRTPRELITHPGMRGLIDFGQPVAILILATLHFIADDEQPDEIIRLLRATMAPGSYLALSHITAENVHPVESKAAQEIYAGASAPAIPRPREVIIRFFDEMELLPPGLVNINAWPAADVQRVPGSPLLMYGGVARKS